jgi:cytochrome c oxidase assembly factor CtaG
MRWPVEPGVWVGLVVAGWLYLRGARGVRGWPRSRTRLFLGGLAALFVALGSPLASYDTESLTAHMIQHLLLTHVAAPLLLLGAPVTLLVRTTSWRIRWVHLAGHPLVTWLAFVAVMVGTHYSGLYDAALRNEFVHILEHALFLGSALLFWWPVVGIDPGAARLPYPLRIVYLLLSMPVQAWLGLSIYSRDSVLYPYYALVDSNALADQRTAAAVMWVGGDLLTLAAIALVVLAWMRYDARLAAREDRRSGTV